MTSAGEVVKTAGARPRRSLYHARLMPGPATLDGRSARRRALAVVATLSLIPAVVLGLVGLVAGSVVAVVIFVLLAAGLAALVWWYSEVLVLSWVGGKPPDAIAHARLINLTEGLCTAAGVHLPKLRVLPDATINALAAGWRPGKAVVAVTEGALRSLSRIELEAVLAAEIMRIRRGETVAATLSAAALGMGERIACWPGGDVISDQAAVSLTRYPPGLVAAFDKMESAGVAVRSSRRALGPLWLVDFSGSPRRLGLEERIEALLEL